MKRFQNILYVTSSASLNDSGFQRALNLADENDAQLSVLLILPEMLNHISMMNTELLGGAFPDSLLTQSREQLQQALKSRCGDRHCRVDVQIGISYIATIKQVVARKCDLVVKAAENNVLSQLFAHDDKHLLRMCPCPVWLIKPELPDKCRNIVVALDIAGQQDHQHGKTHEALNTQLLEMGLSLAIAEFAQLHVVNVVADFDLNVLGEYTDIGQGQLDGYVTQARARHQKALDHMQQEFMDSIDPAAIEYAKPQWHLLVGTPAQQLCDYVDRHEVDLMIMGSVARTGIPGFFIGNTAEKVLGGIHCSTLTIKPEDFVSPIA